MKNKPLILITNDDGVKSGGISALIEAVRPYGDLLVVAPDSSKSGMSHAMTVKVPLYLSQVSQEEGLTIYKSNGTPADCVKMALGEILDKKPDYVLSGINHGTNSSISAFYSGTVAGAREGAFNSIPSIAFSLCDYNLDADFSEAANICRQIFLSVLENGMKPNDYFNVNIPKGDLVKEIKICRHAKGKWVEQFDKRKDPYERSYYWLTGYFENSEKEATDTDEWALNNGFASLVPCSIDATYHNRLKEMKDSFRFL
ncbi:MAG: 5'/3'-nucleotidase SurE [Marinilabiliaceae bacterium]|nr:5'/3'-nucleotidase SurE [Marinilabiliaceae bacterium]